MTILSLLVHQQIPQHHQSFIDAKPFRHVIIDDFFNRDFCQQLLQDFPGFEARYALNEMGNVGGKAVRMDVRDISDAYRALDAHIQTPEFLRLIEQITGIPDLLYDTEYIGGGTHENRHGQGLDAHVDFNYHPTTGWHRRLNLIVYLNHEWEENWGGNIEFQSDPWNPEASDLKRVLPLFNRAVIFETNEYSWHGFEAIRLPADKQHLSRRSFAIYLYTRERPSEERAASHATVYVPAGLPADLAAGEVLSDARVTDLRIRFQRMLSQLRFLYQRELDFSTQIASLERALNEARQNQYAGLEGYAKQQQVAGLWPDAWVARHFRLVFEPTRRVEQVTLQLWVPDALAAGQQFRITLDGESRELTLAPGRCQTVDFKRRFEAGQSYELTVDAANDWTPSDAGDSSDARPLAWRLVRLVVE